MKIRVLLLGPSIKCKGGIASVLRNYLSYPPIDEVEFRFVSVRGDQGSLVKLLQSVFGLFKTGWILASERVDIIHAHPSEEIGFYRYIPYLIVGKLFRKKVLFHIHGGRFDEFYREQISIIQWLIKFTLKSCDHVICLSESWVTVFKEIGVQRIEIIQNTVNQPNYNPYNPDSQYLTFMGFIEKRKGIFDLAKALKICMATSSVVLNVCGTGDVEDLNFKISEYGIQDKILNHGWINANQKDRILKDSVIFILPSYIEGLPMVVLEAMAYGIPVISTPVGGIPELIEDGIDGVLVTPGDIEGLATAIDNLFNNQEMRIRMSNAAYEKIKQGYTMKVTFEKLSKLYSEILAEKG